MRTGRGEDFSVVDEAVDRGSGEDIAGQGLSQLLRDEDDDEEAS
ncbi:MAG TPA: hypothetical protein VLZ05_17405 [Mycobacterium sp.]|nr:hypothetical protein [Mycobacterium sp.]HUH70472.1 hypothetical protein [Mycobacterium sp.]